MFASSKHVADYCEGQQDWLKGGTHSTLLKFRFELTVKFQCLGFLVEDKHLSCHSFLLNIEIALNLLLLTLCDWWQVEWPALVCYWASYWRYLTLLSEPGPIRPNLHVKRGLQCLPLFCRQDYFGRNALVNKVQISLLQYLERQCIQIKVNQFCIFEALRDLYWLNGVV